MTDEQRSEQVVTDDEQVQAGYDNECAIMLARIRRNAATIRALVRNYQPDETYLHVWRAVYIARWQWPVVASIFLDNQRIFYQLQLVGYESKKHSRILQGKTVTAEEVAVFFGLHASSPTLVEWTEQLFPY